MFTRLTMLFVLLLASAAGVAQIYKWVDEDGVIHYSDQPAEGAEIINLPKSSSTNSAPRRPQQAAAASDGNDTAGGQRFSYSSLTVQSPAAEETLWNIQGTLNVALNLQPSLREGHRLRIYFDGEPQTVDALQFQLDEVWRGEHNLQAEVLDSTNTVMIRSDPIRFFVQQTSVVN